MTEVLDRKPDGHSRDLARDLICSQTPLSRRVASRRRRARTNTRKPRPKPAQIDEFEDLHAEQLNDYFGVVDMGRMGLRSWAGPMFDHLLNESAH
jgi:hypothetical protein